MSFLSWFITQLHLAVLTYRNLRSSHMISSSAFLSYYSLISNKSTWLIFNIKWLPLWGYAYCWFHMEQYRSTSQVVFLCINLTSPLIITWIFFRTSQGLPQLHTWIGLQCLSSECNSTKYATWTWKDQSNITYQNWDIGQPTGYTYCARMLPLSGKWSSVDCRNEYTIMCEREAFQDNFDTSESHIETTASTIHTPDDNSCKGGKS